MEWRGQLRSDGVALTEGSGTSGIPGVSRLEMLAYGRRAVRYSCPGRAFFLGIQQIMNLKVPALLIGIGALAGCASVKDINARDPVFYGSTARTAAEYVQCVDSAWKGLGTTAEQQEVRNGYELIVRGTMGVEAVLTATTWKGKTDARLSTRIQRTSTALAESANLCL